MKKYLVILIIGVFSVKSASAQIDINNLDLNKILGQVMNVQHGFAPKFFLGGTPLQKIQKVEEILGLKQNEDINRLFRTYKTGRTIYRVASFAGGALAIYGIAKKANNAVQNQNYSGLLTGGLVTIGSGLAVKFLTKAASYKAVDLFNGIAVKKIKDILSVAPASNTAGVGLYVKL